MTRPTAEELLERALDAGDPAVALRLRREAEARRAAELQDALRLVADAIARLRGSDLMRLMDRVGSLYGAGLARLKCSTRSAALEALRRARSTEPTETGEEGARALLDRVLPSRSGERGGRALASPEPQKSPRGSW